MAAVRGNFLTSRTYLEVSNAAICCAFTATLNGWGTKIISINHHPKAGWNLTHKSTFCSKNICFCACSTFWRLKVFSLSQESDCTQGVKNHLSSASDCSDAKQASGLRNQIPAQNQSHKLLNQNSATSCKSLSPLYPSHLQAGIVSLQQSCQL